MTNTQIDQDVTPFAEGRVYSCRSVCDQNAVWHFEIIRRTAARVTLRELNQAATKTVAIRVHDGRETCRPLGSYSMAPVLRA